MSTEVSPAQLQRASHAGFKRLRNFRQARLMFIRNYVGQYYDQYKGEIGTEPLNLIFNAIRVLVPNLVMTFPTHNVSTEFLAYRDYAALASKALDFNGKQMGIVDVYRRWIVDAIFTVGIVKTGLAESGTPITIEDDIFIDPGEVYTANVDFDNFVFDPTVRGDIRESAFIGDRSFPSRRELLESGLYNNTLIERLPAIQYGRDSGPERETSGLSRRNVTSEAFLEEEVAVTELFVPAANAVVTVPGMKDVVFDDYLRIADYVGDPEGPYTLLSFTPPVPGNPLPVAMVGIWNDLHVLANRMAKKIIDQAERQKDVAVYKPASTDDAIELRDAKDGEMVATEDPQGVQVLSFGGQKQSNETHIVQLQGWFNMMAANPQGIGGQDLRADSATEAKILSQNANIGLDDMQNLIYVASGKEADKRLFYMHTDPLINMPLVRRIETPTMDGMVQQDIQVFLNPEARRGDALDYSVTIEPNSMQRVDHNVRLQRAVDFGVRLLPTAVNAAVMAFQVGIPFNFTAYLRHMAKESGIEWMDEVLFDPTFMARQKLILAMGPQLANSTGQPAPPSFSQVKRNVLQPGGTSPLAGAAPMGGAEQFRSDAQSGAATGQRELRGFSSPSDQTGR